MSDTPSTPDVDSGSVSVAEVIDERKHALDSIEERRRWPRSVLGETATLRALSGAEIPARPVDNLSEGGLHLTAPIGFGMAVGQRYEVLLGQPDTGNDPLAGEVCYATVVRTRIVLDSSGDGDRLGVGMCFDAPIAL
ncbi:MAG: hypothetical protein GY842_15710 [bacterium]|nr:hypothetical protein [bacterium]